MKRPPSGLLQRRSLLQTGALALLLGVRHRAHAATILAVRVWPAPDYSRVTIESDTPLSEKHFLAANPQRLVIDIDGLELSAELRVGGPVRIQAMMWGLPFRQRGEVIEIEPGRSVRWLVFPMPLGLAGGHATTTLPSAFT